MKKATHSKLIVAKAAVLSILLSACAVGPDFEKPAAPDVHGYGDADVSKATVSSEGGAGVAQKFSLGKDISGVWWSLFKSEAIDDLVRKAFDANPSLKAAQASLVEAQQNYYAGIGSFLPSVSANGTAERQKASSLAYGSSDKIYNLYNASVGVSYTFDLFGKTQREVEALGAQVDYERFQMEAAYLSLTSNLVTAALQDASTRAQIEATHEIVDAQRKQLEMVRKQLELGGVSRSAVLAQETSLAQTEASLPALEKAESQYQNQISVLTGRYPGQEKLPELSLDAMRLPEELPVSLPSKLVEQRPDVQAAEAQMHAASAEVGVATANMLPQITLSGNLGSATQKLGDLLTPGGGIWSLAGNVSQPLFEGGALYHKRGAAEAALDAATSNYKATVLTAFQNVADVLRALETDARSLQAAVVTERAARSSLDLAERQFKVGALSYLGLLNAQTAYQQAKISLVKAQVTRFVDTVALYQALGGGWWNRTNDTTDADEAEKKVPPSPVLETKDHDGV